MIRLAEITSIILCACFPIVPRFVQLIRERYPNSQPSTPSPIRHVRKSKIFRIGNAKSSTGISSEGPQEVHMAWLNSPYQPLGEEESERTRRQSVIRDLKSKRTVDFEMVTRNQLNTRSCVASIA